MQTSVWRNFSYIFYFICFVTQWSIFKMNRKLPWYPQITTVPMYSSCVVHPAKQSSFVRILLFLRKRLLSFTYMVNLYPYNISKTLKIQRFICPSDNRADELLTRSLPQRTCSNHLQMCNLSYFLPNAESKKKNSTEKQNHVYLKTSSKNDMF